MSFEGSTASKSNLSSLSLTNKVAAFREINGKARTYFHLQHTLKPNPARAKATCPQALPPRATSTRKPEAAVQSTCLPRLRRQSARFSERLQGGLWKPARRPAADAGLQVTRSLKTGSA